MAIGNVAFFFFLGAIVTSAIGPYHFPHIMWVPANA